MEIAGRVQLLDSGDLLIAAVKTHDAGKYACLRSNEAGSVNGSAYLSVLGDCLSELLNYIITTVAGRKNCSFIASLNQSKQKTEKNKTKQQRYYKIV